MGKAAPHSRVLGIVFVVATLVGWASILLFLKYLAPFMDGWTSNGWRYGLSALLWLPLLLVGAWGGTLPRGIWRRALWPSVANLLGQTCFALAPYYIGPGLEGFLLRCSIVFSVGGALIFFADERVLVRSPVFWVGLALLAAGMCGTVLLGSIPLEGPTAVGVALGLSAGAFFGLYGLGVRHWMHGIPAMTSFAVISLYSAVGMVAAMIFMGDEHGLVVFHMDLFNWEMLVLSALIGIALGHVFYYAAIARLGIAVASAVIQVAPFLGAIGSMLLFREVLTLRQWASGGILLVGALLVLRAEQRRRSGPGRAGLVSRRAETAAVPCQAVPAGREGREVMPVGAGTGQEAGADSDG